MKYWLHIWDNNVKALEELITFDTYQNNNLSYSFCKSES